MFQSYLRKLQFSIQRCGHLYGTFDAETKSVSVEAIFEPIQIADANEAIPLDGSIPLSDEEKQPFDVQSSQISDAKAQLDRADQIAGLLGWSRVGFIFSRPRRGKSLPLTNMEIYRLCHLQRHGGPHFVTVTAVINKKKNTARFEAFQLSDQAIKLWRLGWLQRPKPLSSFDPSVDTSTSSSSSSSHLRADTETSSRGSNRSSRSTKSSKQRSALRKFLSLLTTSKPVNVAGKLTTSIDCPFFTIPLAIQATTSLLETEFPVENRPEIPQAMQYLKDRVQKAKSQISDPSLSSSQKKALAYSLALADFHALLFISQVFDMNDMALIIPNVVQRSPLQDGYIMLLDAQL